MLDEFTKANLALWNEWTDIHEKSSFYDVDGFRAGGLALKPLEAEELGDVAGLSLLHLQCHFGLDTLSWARLGAHVTGVDFSDKAVALARSLAAELGIEATFLQSRVEELDTVLDRRFDIVFTSYGAIEWLPDLELWAGVIARHLEPGGTFYMAEIHPFAQMLEQKEGETDVRLTYPYFPTGKPDACEVEGSYADPTAKVDQEVCYGWNHSFAEIFGALIGAGLRIEYLHEFPFSVSPFWPTMTRAEDGWFYLPGERRDIPFVFSLKATMVGTATHVPGAG